jgi:hypothetical protein
MKYIIAIALLLCVGCSNSPAPTDTLNKLTDQLESLTEKSFEVGVILGAVADRELRWGEKAHSGTTNYETGSSGQTTYEEQLIKAAKYLRDAKLKEMRK